MNKYMPEGMLISEKENYEYISSPEGLKRAQRDGIILEGVATLCDHSFNLHIELPCKMRAIIPRSEIAYSYTDEQIKDIAILTRVGKPVAFKVLGFEQDISGSYTAILSRRSAQRECYHNYIEALAPGDIIPARVTHLENFGAFVDIGCGIVSLLSIDSISVSRISHPSARVCVGDAIYTIVKNIDDKGRIYVSSKELLGSWEENAAHFSEGQTVRGIIRSIESYGIFVELKPNLAGLAEYKEDAEVGAGAAVYIKSIIPEKMKIKLIIIASEDVADYPSPLEYYIDTKSVTHIDNWRYSPKISKRVIESVF